MAAPASRAGRVLLAFVLAVAAAGVGAQTDHRPSWASLTPEQQQALAPLKRDWSLIETNRKQKWLEVAARLPKMPADERARVQARMNEWAQMTPSERGRARQQFQEASQLSAEERQARWQAYQALPADEKHQLVQRAKPGGKVPVAADPKAKPGATTTTLTTRATPPPHHQPGLPKIAATPGSVDPATLLPKRGPQGAAVRAATSSDPTRQP